MKSLDNFIFEKLKLGKNTNIISDNIIAYYIYNDYNEKYEIYYSENELLSNVRKNKYMYFNSSENKKYHKGELKYVKKAINIANEIRSFSADDIDKKWDYFHGNLVQGLCKLIEEEKIKAIDFYE